VIKRISRRTLWNLQHGCAYLQKVSQILVDVISDNVDLLRFSRCHIGCHICLKHAEDLGIGVVVRVCNVGTTLQTN
jgi:hypothetical protein